MASHVWDYIVYYAWAFCSCPFFAILGNAKAYGLRNGRRERTHAFCFKSIKANVGLIYLILGFCRKHNE